MTPKEKAFDIYEKMYYCFQRHIDDYTTKECAKVAVKLILEEYWHHDRDREKYWQDVRKEIPKI